MRDFYLRLELGQYHALRTMPGWTLDVFLRIFKSWLFFVGPALTLPLMMLPRALRDRRLRFLVITGSVAVAAMELETFYAVHYAAPTVCIILALLLQSMRHLAKWRWYGKPTGLFLARSAVAICVLMVPLQVPMARELAKSAIWRPMGDERAAVLKHLESLPGGQLVIVRYGPKHDPLVEWVYNEADIDHSKVVWARDMGEAENERLIQYFGNRTIWLLGADEAPPRLSRYGASP